MVEQIKAGTVLGGWSQGATRRGHEGIFRNVGSLVYGERICTRFV